ncbi:MAG TPA: type I 3-dehydroquinate dehydratase [Clostridia bacterium]|nr:type I 3-dehydroquinate dehydratase [Clostridia bacterium]
MRPSFVQLPKPFIACVVTEPDPDSAIATIRNSEYDGAHAFDLHLRSLEQQYHNKNDLERIIKCTSKPMLMINYRTNSTWAGQATDEERVESHLIAVEAGASACDLMGDLYDPSPLEITHKPEAIDRQRRLIDKLHAKGVEVLMSSHTWVPMTCEQVVEQLKALEARGADMVKVAAAVNNDEELVEAFKTTLALKRELKVPFVHICMGQHGKIHRFVGPMLGSSLIFTVQNYTPKGHKEQPLVRAAKAVFDNLDWRVARSALEEGEE